MCVSCATVELADYVSLMMMVFVDEMVWCVWWCCRCWCVAWLHVVVGVGVHVHVPRTRHRRDASCQRDVAALQTQHTTTPTTTRYSASHGMHANHHQHHHTTTPSRIPSSSTMHHTSCVTACVCLTTVCVWSVCENGRHQRYVRHDC